MWCDLSKAIHLCHSCSFYKSIFVFLLSIWFYDNYLKPCNLVISKWVFGAGKTPFGAKSVENDAWSMSFVVIKNLFTIMASYRGAKSENCLLTTTIPLQTLYCRPFGRNSKSTTPRQSKCPLMTISESFLFFASSVDLFVWNTDTLLICPYGALKKKRSSVTDV